MEPGETFFGFDLGNHLWAVLSTQTPAGMIAVANLTTHGRAIVCARGGCVVIQPGEHRFVRTPTCVFYRGATLTVAHSLDDARSRGMLDQHDPLSPDLLRRIQEGALASDLVSLEVQQAVAASLSDPFDQ